jgi:hypothetical protein
MNQQREDHAHLVSIPTVYRLRYDHIGKYKNLISLLLTAETTESTICSSKHPNKDMCGMSPLKGLNSRQDNFANSVARWL